MDANDPIYRAWLDATNCFLAGMGLPPLKAAAVRGPDPDSQLYKALLRPADRDDYERDYDPDYAGQDWASRHMAVDNHQMSADERLDDPRRGQADL